MKNLSQTSAPDANPVFQILFQSVKNWQRSLQNKLLDTTDQSYGDTCFLAPVFSLAGVKQMSLLLNMIIMNMIYIHTQPYNREIYRRHMKV